ncbi:hypothetical protein G4B88_028301 [Cannabis sativa]|uniref:Uncharacterized protein n=1 Tax=Cannabis sativa TaxID=3483 RepID=A0A7J6FF99_CANSA|nr:hypothetical protein G4B88_028301 [Cannabis sativa]
MPRTQNRYVDALATMASKIEVSEIQNLTFKIVNQKCSITSGYGKESASKKWTQQMIDKLAKLKKTHLREMQRFVIIGGTLYYRSSDGVLARCLDQEEIST